MAAKPRKKPAGMSLVQWAYEELKARILNNEYAPGFQALEHELAEDLGISRTPVREATKRLEAEGLVEVIPRRGMRVVQLSPDDMREIYEVLTSLETMAAELLARRNPTAKELQPMADAVEKMDAALEADDLDAWAKADETYHKTLLEICGNRRIASLAGTMRDQSHRARMVTLALRPRPWKSNEEHRKVLEAIRAGDWETAKREHEKHRSKSSRLITEILEQYRLPVL